MEADQIPLFPRSTSHEARRIAAKSSCSRYDRIVDALAEKPLCIFEVAAKLRCFDHQISGRFGELERRGLIEKTHDRRTNPVTGCRAQVYRLVGESRAVERANVRANIN